MTDFSSLSLNQVLQLIDLLNTEGVCGGAMHGRCSCCGRRSGLISMWRRTRTAAPVKRLFEGFVSGR